MASPSEGERSFRGQIASPGLAIGPAVTLGTLGTRTVPIGDAAVERTLLEQAMAEAAAELARLIEAQVGEDAAAILEFQLAMVEDEELSAPAFQAIGRGIPGDRAWAHALAAQIADCEAADDEYFRARAADLADLRDRVLAGFRAGGRAAAPMPPNAILLGPELTPSRFLETDWSRCAGIALYNGSATSHVAMLARARSVPMLVGLGDLAVERGATVLLDAEHGALVTDPGRARLAEASARRTAHRQARDRESAIAAKPAETADGEAVRVLINVAHPAELEALDPATCDGVGLVRTELLFHGPHGLPDEDAQTALYRRILEWAQGRPVTIRTLDAGGDKPIPGYTIDGEANPFLGVRGVRLSLRRPEVFAVQLRALARAATAGNLRVMLPMVTVPGELEQARVLFAEQVAALEGQGVEAAMPPLGIMVEVPSAAIAMERFEAAFFSIGTNDLIQYITACDRASAALAELCDPLDPAVLGLIRCVAAHGRARGLEVSVCGDMASEPRTVPALLDCGIRTLSVGPAALGRVKAAIAAHRGRDDG